MFIIPSRVCVVLVAGLFLMECKGWGDLVEVSQLHQTGPMGQTVMTITKKIKGTKTRSETTITSGPSGSLAMPMMIGIQDGKTGEMINVMPQMQSYIVVSKSDMKQSLEMVNQGLKVNGAIPTERPQLHDTGKAETVDGYSCEIFTCESAKMKATYWFSKDAELARFQPMLRAALFLKAPTVMSQFPDPATFPGFVVRLSMVQTMSAMGPDNPPMKMTSTTDLVSLKEETIDDGEFEIPKGYKEQTVPGLGR